MTNTESGRNPTVPFPRRAVRLRNGNTLISDQFNQRVIEVTPGKHKNSPFWQPSERNEASTKNHPVIMSLKTWANPAWTNPANDVAYMTFLMRRPATNLEIQEWVARRHGFVPEADWIVWYKQLFEIPAIVELPSPKPPCDLSPKTATCTDIVEVRC